MKDPIFIVGAPRSGTTLLSASLASHSQISCGPETQFFNKLNSEKLSLAIHDRDWPNQAVKSITGLTLAGQKVHELFGLGEDEIRSYLSNHPSSLRAMLEALVKQFAKHQGKQRWAEKTPNHLLHLPLIRRTFPQASIIRIIRDPRDSALSMTKLPLASKSVLANAYLWTDWFEQSHDFCLNDDKTMTVRYEDFLRNPRAILQDICDHIGELFEASMLDTSSSAASVSSANETWKNQVSGPLDLTRMYAWKKKLPESLWCPVTYACESGIKAFGYELVEGYREKIYIYKPTQAFIEDNELEIVRGANSGKALIAAYCRHSLRDVRLKRETLVVYGFPMLRGGLCAKFMDVFDLVKCILFRWIKGYLNLYIHRPETSGSRSRFMRLVYGLTIGCLAEKRSELRLG